MFFPEKRFFLKKLFEKRELVVFKKGPSLYNDPKFPRKRGG